MKTTLLLAAALVACAASGAARASVCEPGYEPSNPDSAYLLGPDGTATDIRTGLVWKRCVEGFTWDGTTCTGSAAFFDWPQAIALAEASTYASAQDWRLPNAKEMLSVAETCRMDPAVNVTVFPLTPTAQTDQFAFWTSSPVVGGTNLSWYVRSGRGDTGEGTRNVTRLVRLVRGSP